MYLSHFICERVDVSVVCERWVEIHILREGTSSCSISSSGSQRGANACTLLLQASQKRTDRLRVPCSTAILYTLSKSDRVVITWSPSGYSPVRPESDDALSSFCLLIKMWQLAKAHEVTRNEPKIHGICYITIGLHTIISIQLKTLSLYQRILLMHDSTFSLFIELF